MSYGAFEALIERHKRTQRDEQWKFAHLMWAIINFSDRAPERKITPDDFMPEEEREELDLTKMSAAKQAEHMINMFSKRQFSR